MKQLTKDRFVLLITVISFIMMVTVNALANILPINGISSGAVSDSYPNLFAPIGYTFSIWGIIYLLLLGFTLYLLVSYYKNGFDGHMFVGRIAIIFSFSSVVNSVWIFAWHYGRIGISLILMTVLLFSLIKINLILKDHHYTMVQKLLLRLPFSIYFGWITVASIANVTTFLVSIGWNRFGLQDDLITTIVLTVGAAIGITAIRAYDDIAFGAVILWAYGGILAKHLSADFFNGAYPVVIAALVVLMALIVAFECYMVLRYYKRGVARN